MATPPEDFTLTSSMQAMDTFKTRAQTKKSPYQKHKSEQEKKRKRDEEEAAAMLKQFEASFVEKESAGGQNFVSGGKIVVDEKGRTSMALAGGTYAGTAVAQQRRAALFSVDDDLPTPAPTSKPSATSKPSSTSSSSSHNSNSTSSHAHTSSTHLPPTSSSAAPSSSSSSKRREMDSLLEELKAQKDARDRLDSMMQQDRDKRERERNAETLARETRRKNADEFPDSTHLLVKNIPSGVTEAQLRLDFAKFGALVAVHVDAASNSASFLYAVRPHALEAMRVMDGARYLGNALTVLWTTPKPEALSAPSARAPLLVAAAGEFVVLAPPPMEQRVIDIVAERVCELGARFEQQLMTKAQGDSRLDFLTLLDSAGNLYYRWRVYSLLQGDTLSSWRTSPFRLFKDGPRFVPPPMPPKDPMDKDSDPIRERERDKDHRDRDSDRDRDRERDRDRDRDYNNKGRDRERERDRDHSTSSSSSSSSSRVRSSQPPMEVSDKVHRGRPLDSDERAALIRLLQRATLERSGVAEVMAFCLERAESASESALLVVSSLLEPSTPLLRKLARLFIAADILHNAAAVPGGHVFRSVLQPALPKIFREYRSAMSLQVRGRITAHTLRELALGVLKAWSEAHLYGEAELARCRDALLQEEDKDNDDMEEEEDKGKDKEEALKRVHEDKEALELLRNEPAWEDAHEDRAAYAKRLALSNSDDQMKQLLVKDTSKDNTLTSTTNESNKKDKKDKKKSATPKKEGATSKWDDDSDEQDQEEEEDKDKDKDKEDTTVNAVSTRTNSAPLSTTTAPRTSSVPVSESEEKDDPKHRELVRAIETEVQQLEEDLESAGYSGDEVEAKGSAYRARLMTQLSKGVYLPPNATAPAPAAPTTTTTTATAKSSTGRRSRSRSRSRERERSKPHRERSKSRERQRDKDTRERRDRDRPNSKR